MKIDILGNISSIIGLIISIITLIIVVFVNKKVKKFQYSNLFDKRVNFHLTSIDKLQNELNSCIPNIVLNEIKIKEILVQLLAEFESLQPKLQDKIARQKAMQLIYKLQKAKGKVFYNTEKLNINIWDRLYSTYRLWFSNMISSRNILDIYILVNENYNRIQQVKLDKKELIK